MKPQARPEDFDVLGQVETLAEFSRACNLDPKAVKYAIDAGHIAWKKSGRATLIHVPSAVRWFFPPTRVKFR